MVSLKLKGGAPVAGRSAVRMADIAAKLGISTVTVSKALSDKDGVGNELKQKIKRTAEEMGYQRKTKNENSGVLGIVLTERLRAPEHSFYWALYMRVIEALKARDYYGILEIVDSEQERSAVLPDFVEQGKADGVFVLGKMEAPYIKGLCDSGIPVVLLDMSCDDVDATAVVTDNLLGGYDATRYLIQKGHRAIGYVGDIRINSNAEDRFYGFCKAMRKNGLEVNEDWIIPDRIGEDFKDVFQLPDRMPTAFFCNNDQCAYHFTRYLQKVGLRIPEDVSIIGYYDHVFTTLLEPPLTSFRIDLRRMADEGADAMLQRIRGDEDVPARIFVTGDIVERLSVADCTAQNEVPE